MPAYEFPAFKPAHEEVYRKGATGQSAFLALVSAGEEIVAKSCKKVSGKGTKWGGGPIKVVKTTRRIRCSFPRKVELRMAVFPGRHELVAALGHTSRAVLHGLQGAIVGDLLRRSLLHRRGRSRRPLTNRKDGSVVRKTGIGGFAIPGLY